MVVALQCRGIILGAYLRKDGEIQNSGGKVERCLRALRKNCCASP